MNSDVSDDESPGGDDIIADDDVAPGEGEVNSLGNSADDEVDIDAMLESMVVLVLIPELSLVVGEPDSLDIMELLVLMPSMDVVGMSSISLLVIMSMDEDWPPAPGLLVDMPPMPLVVDIPPIRLLEVISPIGLLEVISPIGLLEVISPIGMLDDILSITLLEDMPVIDVVDIPPIGLLDDMLPMVDDEVDCPS